MKYQRSHKLERNPVLTEPLGNSHAKIRWSVKGSMPSEKKEYREFSGVNRSRKDYYTSDQKVFLALKQTRMKTEPPRNRTDVGRESMDVKGFKPVEEDSKEKSDKLNRMFVIRAQTNIAAQKIAPVRRPSQLPPIIVL